MKIHKWSEIEKRLSPERRARISKQVEAELLELNLRAVRELVGKTQVDVAGVTKMRQADVSKMERRADHLLSTLRRYVEALGGELEVTANFGDKRVRLRGV
jgi:hypothetical protein